MVNVGFLISATLVMVTGWNMHVAVSICSDSSVFFYSVQLADRLFCSFALVHGARNTEYAKLKRNQPCRDRNANYL